MMLLFFVNSLIIIHLGMNPDRGGSPPNDNIVNRISVDMSGVLFHRCDNDRVVVEELKWSIINTESVIMI